MSEQLFQPVTVRFISGDDDQAKLIETSEDIAWEAVVTASQVEGVEVGSDDFIIAFTKLKKRYAECAENFSHLSFLAASLLKSLMDAGLALVYPANDSSDEALEDYLQALVSMILSQTTTIYGVGPTGWISNREWDKLPEEARTVTFELMRPVMEDKDDTYND